MKNFSVKLEDNGQDFTEFITDESGKIIDVKPFQKEIWQGGFIPLEDQKIGDFCMMHKPPHIVFGAIKHKVISINEINQ